MLKELFKPVLTEAQKAINDEHAEKGLTDKVLEAQVELNKIRHALDIHDKDDELYEEFVQ